MKPDKPPLYEDMCFSSIRLRLDATLFANEHLSSFLAYVEDHRFSLYDERTWYFLSEAKRESLVEFLSVCAVARLFPTLGLFSEVFGSWLIRQRLGQIGIDPTFLEEKVWLDTFCQILEQNVGPEDVLFS